MSAAAESTAPMSTPQVLAPVLAEFFSQPTGA
jgi:hypothetical protein